MADEIAAIPINSIDFHYIKSSAFRVAHVDGVYGGLSPHGYVHCTFFSERPTIPRHSRITFSKDGTFNGTEEILETKGGLTREVEVDVVMNLTSLVGIHHWMGSKMEELRLSIGMSDEVWEQMKRSAVTGGGAAKDA